MNRHPRMLCSALVLMLIASVGCVPDGTACASSPGACAADASAMSTGGAGLDGRRDEDASPGTGDAVAGGGTGGTSDTGSSVSVGDSGSEMDPNGGCAQCGGQTPYCREGECVECTEAEHCAAGVRFLISCVDCRVSDDWKDVTASRCTQGRECAACEAN